jgi:glucokinase
MALYEAMHDDKPASSEAITSAPEEKRNRETLDQFFLFLGSVAAELALITGAYGGVYIAGGIVPAIVDVAQASGFRERFENKNRYRDYMRAIPTWIITDPYPGLTGLQAWIAQGCRRP